MPLRAHLLAALWCFSWRLGRCFCGVFGCCFLLRSLRVLLGRSRGLGLGLFLFLAQLAQLSLFFTILSLCFLINFSSCLRGKCIARRTAAFFWRYETCRRLLIIAKYSLRSARDFWRCILTFLRLRRHLAILTGVKCIKKGGGKK